MGGVRPLRCGGFTSEARCSCSPTRAGSPVAASSPTRSVGGGGPSRLHGLVVTPRGTVVNQEQCHRRLVHGSATRSFRRRRRSLPEFPAQPTPNPPNHPNLTPAPTEPSDPEKSSYTSIRPAFQRLRPGVAKKVLNQALAARPPGHHGGAALPRAFDRQSTIEIRDQELRRRYFCVVYDGVNPEEKQDRLQVGKIRPAQPASRRLSETLAMTKIRNI